MEATTILTRGAAGGMFGHLLLYMRADRLFEEMTMLELHCRDVGFDCPEIIRGATKAEVLEKAAVHAKEVHGTQVTPELATRVSALIHGQGIGGDNATS
jgi:predicted small metal-binding protein